MCGCSGGEGELTLQVTLPDAVAGHSAELVLSRFDIAAVTDSFAATAGIPQPDFSSLEAEMSLFRPERSEGLDSLENAWFEIRKDIVRLADSLTKVGREAPGYQHAYERLRALHNHVTNRETDLERRMSQLVPTESVDLARRAIRAADSLRAWEKAAHAGLPRLLDSLSGVFGPVEIIPIPPDGEIRRRLASGKWWVAMRIPDPQNPFLEYYWDTSFSVNQLVPIVVPLNKRQLHVRWRH